MCSCLLACWLVVVVVVVLVYVCMCVEEEQVLWSNKLEGDEMGMGLLMDIMDDDNLFYSYTVAPFSAPLGEICCCCCWFVAAAQP